MCSCSVRANYCREFCPNFFDSFHNLFAFSIFNNLILKQSKLFFLIEMNELIIFYIFIKKSWQYNLRTFFLGFIKFRPTLKNQQFHKLVSYVLGRSWQFYICVQNTIFFRRYNLNLSMKMISAKFMPFLPREGFNVKRQKLKLTP